MKPLRTLGASVALLCLSCAVGATTSLLLDPLSPAAETIAPVVEQTGWVTDAAEIIPDDVEQRLVARLAKLERRTRHQMVVVTVPTLAGRDVAEVADHLDSAWQVGRPGYNDGVVVLIAPNERRMRIATADGMQQLLPDETCQQVIDDTMLPHFRKGDLVGGIEAGTDALISHLE